MAYPRTIRNYNAFVDGVSYFGRVAKGVMPELTLMTEEFRGGGMDAPLEVDLGMEAMTAELEFDEHAPALLQTLGTRTKFVLRAGALGEDDFEADTLAHTLGGRIKAQKTGEFGGGERVALTLTMAVDYYRVEHNGAVMVEIDVRNGKRVIGGTDQMAGLRAALAI